MRHLVVSVVERVLTGQRDGVALSHAHMTERLKRIGRFEEISAVACQHGSLVAEMHFSVEHLGVTIAAVLVVSEFIGMYQIDALVGFLPWALLSRCLS